MKAHKPMPTPLRRIRLSHLFPFLIWGKRLTGRSLYADLLAGLTGAVIVLPQGIAYAMIAELPPEYGIYTAIITPIVAALFGSSLHLLSGPTAAISIVVLSVTSGVAELGSPEFITSVLTLTLLAGLIQFGFGLARLGTLVNFISHTVVLGFTAGAAMLIGTSQLKYALGVEVPNGSSFIDTWGRLLHQVGDTHLLALAIALVTLLTTLVIKKISRKLPNMLLGMTAGSLFCWLLDGENKGIALVGELPTNLPGLSSPDLSPEMISTLLPGALAVAVLGLVEAVSIARAIAIRSGQRIDGNQEFIGQGLSNIVGGMFSCYAGSGSFGRSGANYDAGAQTPAAALFGALILVLILFFLPRVTAYLPMPVMGGAILLIAWNLIDWHHIRQVIQSNKQEAAVLLVTFCSTLFIELEFAIYVGVILSLMLYLRRTSRPTLMEVAPQSFEAGTDLRSVRRFDLSECPEIKVIRIDGTVFFGAVDHIQRQIRALWDSPGSTSHLLIHCPGINFIDLAGAEMFLQEAKWLKQSGGELSFCGMKNTVKDELQSIHYLEKLGPENFYLTPDDALKHLIPTSNKKTCRSCRYRVFLQCPATC
ncbi:MAG: SulP family inorganic anion transporter [Motiliproteus sp.]